MGDIGIPRRWVPKVPQVGFQAYGTQRTSGSTAYNQRPAPEKRGCCVKLAKRLAMALGSLLALAIAGGAHWRW